MAGARGSGNKIAASAHGMGSGGLVVDAMAIGCLGVERRVEQFFPYLEPFFRFFRPEANVKDNGFPWPPPGLVFFLLKTKKGRNEALATSPGAKEKMQSYLACCGLGETGWFKRGAVSRARNLRALQQERPGREVTPLEETNATLNMFLNYECQLDDDDMSADDHASDMAALGMAVSVARVPPPRASMQPLTPCTVFLFCIPERLAQARRAKEPAWAIRYLTNAIELGYPGHAIWAERAACYAVLEEYDEALEDALVCIRLNPLSGVGFARKGEALMGKGMLGAAEVAFTDGLQVNPGLAMLLSGVAEVRQRRVVAAFGDNVHWYPPPFVTVTWKAAAAAPAGDAPASAKSAVHDWRAAAPASAVDALSSTDASTPCSETNHSRFLSVPLDDKQEDHRAHVMALLSEQHEQEQDKGVRQVYERRLSCGSSECGQNPDARSVETSSPLLLRRSSKKKKDWFAVERGREWEVEEEGGGGDSTPGCASDEAPNSRTKTPSSELDAFSSNAPNQESRHESVSRTKGFNIADGAFAAHLFSSVNSGWVSGDDSHQGSPPSEVCV